MRSDHSSLSWPDDLAARHDPWMHPRWLTWSRWMTDSFRRWTGRDLLPAYTDNDIEHARAMFESPLVIVSHGKQPDPILFYANRSALKLWEYPLVEFCRTPSRFTAEPVHRDERATLLARTTRDGFVDDYTGIRIARSGQRFRIRDAYVWNVLDGVGHYAGQAASFSNFEMLDDNQ